MTVLSRLLGLKAETSEDLEALEAALSKEAAEIAEEIAKGEANLSETLFSKGEAAGLAAQQAIRTLKDRASLLPVALEGVRQRRAEAEQREAMQRLEAAMVTARRANDERRAALKRLHLLFVEAAQLLESADTADAIVRKANSDARAAGRRDLQIKAIETEVSQKMAVAFGRLGISPASALADFQLGAVQLPGYVPAVPYSADREFMARPLSLIA